MLYQATITAILPDDRLRVSFKPNAHETIESIVTRHVAVDVQVGSRIDVDWDRERGITRILWPASKPGTWMLHCDDVDALRSRPDPKPAEQPVTATAEVLQCYPEGYLIEYEDGPIRGKRDTVLVAEGMNVGKVKSGYIVTIRDPGNQARIVAAHDPDDVTESEPSFDSLVRMALGDNPLVSKALASIRDCKQILAALGMPETNTVRDVADAVAELRTELGLPAGATWTEIVSAARDTEESWEAVQRERANLCKALGIAEGSSFNALLAEVTNITTLASMQSKAMREAVRDIRQWMGVRGEEIDETDLADDLALLQRELLRCSGAHVRGSRSIVDGLRAVAAVAYTHKLEWEMTRFAAPTSDVIARFTTDVDTKVSPCEVLVDVEATARASVVMRAVINVIEQSHRPCSVKFTLRAPDGVCSLTFTASPVPGEEGWS